MGDEDEIEVEEKKEKSSSGGVLGYLLAIFLGINIGFFSGYLYSISKIKDNLSEESKLVFSSAQILDDSGFGFVNNLFGGLTGPESSPASINTSPSISDVPLALQNVTPTPELPSPTEEPAKAYSYIIPADYYSQVKENVARKDKVIISAEREGADIINQDSEVYTKAITTLNDIDESEKNIQKIITFSSIEDIKTLLANIPVDVNWINYKVDAQKTPVTEVGSNLIQNLTELKGLIHDSKRKIMLQADVSLLDELQTQGVLEKAVVQIDALVYDAGSVLTAKGESQLMNSVETNYGYAKTYNPQLLFILKFASPPNSSTEVINILSNNSKFISSCMFDAESNVEELNRIIELSSR